MKWLRIVLAIIAGEIALVLLTTLVQEVVFDGIAYSSSPLQELFLGGAGTFLAAVAAGLIAMLVMGERNLIPPIVISLIIILESSWLIGIRGTGDPVWFDVLAAASLIVGIWLGLLVYERYWGRRAQAEPI